MKGPTGRMSAADYQAMLASTKPRRKPKRQQESLNQKEYVRRLNAHNLGFFYRVKNMGTFDPTRGFFRKNQELVSVPDICGASIQNTKGGPVPVYIEVKLVHQIEKRKKLLFKVKITDGQCDFLLKMHRLGCRAGVAFNYYDAICIASGDGTRYPRHPRTFCFLPKDELEEYAAHYAELKRRHAENASDPVIKEVIWAID